jgi:PAS domain S-box-containing protein
MRLVIPFLATDAYSNLERSCLESEEHFRQFADALHDVIALTDATGRTMHFVNAAYEEIWGRPRAELYSDALALLEGVHPEDRERVGEGIIRLPLEDHDLEFRVVRPAGDQRWVWRRSFPVRNSAGEIDRVASITEDITDRKRVIESHERLIRGFTHDVKNPLGAAAGYMALLEERVFGDLSTKQMECVERARHSINVALGLVTQLLEIERAEAGQFIVERRPVDVGAVSREIMEAFRPAAEAKGHALTLLLPREDDALVIESDAERLRQILANLVSNATKYTQAGGQIIIRTWCAANDAAPRPGRWVAVAVEDNGPGIPFEKQNLLFREFTRFQPDAAAGTGLGLAISQRLAHALGGSIAFRSTPGGGSTFTLWLPNNARASAES